MKLRTAILYAVLGISLSSALGAAGYAFPQDRANAPLPQDEGKLLEYAQGRMNQGDWIQADKVFKSWLEKFPDSKQAPHVHAQLANLHNWHSRRYAEAREWLAKAVAKWPQSPDLWSWRFQIAQSWANQGLRDKAVEEFRKISKEAPDAQIRTNAIQQAWSTQGKYFQLHVNQTFTAGQEPVVQVNLSQVDKVDYRATHIKWEALLDVLGGKDRKNLQESIAKVGKEGRKLLKEWSAAYSYEKNRGWKNETIKVPSTEPGVYILEGLHDGVTMSVTLLVSRNGLITKAAAGKLLAFVQDRSTSKPVEGATVRILQGDASIEGKTDAQGLFTTDAFKGGTVVAVKDGDLATTESHWYGNAGEQTLFHVTTDRPIYRPNQPVYFRVVHRAELGEKLIVKEGEKRVVEIRDAKGNKIYEKTHVFNAFGSTEGEITLGDEPPLGEYKIFLRAPQDDPNTYQHSWQWYGHWGDSGPSNFGKFRVDEYRKPEYKVDVDFKKSPVLQGDTVEASILAKYYFGSPVVDAEVKYTVHRRHHWYSWRCWEYYYDWYTEDGDGDEIYESKGRRGGRGGWGLGEQVLQGSGKTDKEGRLRVSFEAQKADYDAVYTVVAHVTDLSRRTVDGSATCKATRAEFGLAMSLNKYVYKPGEKINARVRAATPDDQVVPNATVKVKAFDRRWRDGKHDDEFLFEGSSTTDALGIAEFDLAPRRDGGYLWIVAEAADKRGNKVTTEGWAWLCGDGWSGDTVNLNGVDLVLDKKTYNIGDTAQALVTSQFRNVTLLFTVEGKEIFHHQIVAVKGHTKLIEFKIDKAAYAPNVFLEVVAIKENAVVQKRKMIVVNPSERFIKVEVTPDKSQYRPRNKAVYSVSTTGPDGKPVAAEVSLGVVDESIYALQGEYAWDIRKHFIHRRGNEVGTTTSLQYWDYGRADEERKSDRDAAKPSSAAAPRAEKASLQGGLKDGKEQGGGAAYAATEVRSKFADTMVWKTVRTGADGKATVEVEIPDNLTTWRATARASTADSRFGQSNNDVLVRKEMIVRLEAPRFFTQNDEVIFSAIAHNYMAVAKDVKIEMTSTGLDVTGAAERIVRVDSQGQARIDWKAKVRTAGAAVITVKALAEGDSDAMQLTVPVLAHGAMKWESKGGIVDGKVVEKVTIPAGAAKDAAELVVVLSPTHAAMVLDALEYLAGYPYGCVEQTMSRFLPTVVVAQALQKLGIEKKELQAELPTMISTGLQRLYNFQQQDGGWGWWQNDKSNPWTTAYVVLGLAMAKNADHYVEPHVLARGMQALQQHLAAAKEADLQAYCLYALSIAGVRMDVVRDQLTDKLSELGPYSKALLALVMAKDGRKAKEVVDALAKQVVTAGAAAHFEGQADRGGWMDHAMEVTAACLRAFLAVDPKHALVPRMVHWLATVRQGNYWGSTKQTAMVVFGLVEYLAYSGDLNPDMTLSFSLNGQRILSERITKANWHTFDGLRKFKGAQLKEGENEIVIEREGNGTPVWSIYAKSYAEGEDLPASQGGIRVERTYGRVINDAGKRIVLRLDSGAEVTSGDEIEVTITVTADRDHEWLMLDCPMPSGFEAVREYWGHPGWGRWNYWYSRKEFRDEKVSIAMTTLGRGTHTVQYVMRAEAPGDVHILPAGVFNMYHPQIGGNSSEFRLKVKDR